MSQTSVTGAPQVPWSPDGANAGDVVLDDGASLARRLLQ